MEIERQPVGLVDVWASVHPEQRASQRRVGDLVPTKCSLVVNGLHRGEMKPYTLDNSAVVSADPLELVHRLRLPTFEIGSTITRTLNRLLREAWEKDLHSDGKECR